MATDPTARVAALNARGLAMMETRETVELCDLYVLTRAAQHAALEDKDEFAALAKTVGWMAQVLEQRDPAAAARWCDAEEAIDAELIARDAWTPGGSDLPPHLFFGCEQSTEPQKTRP